MLCLIRCDSSPGVRRIAREDQDLMIAKRPDGGHEIVLSLARRRVGTIGTAVDNVTAH